MKKLLLLGILLVTISSSAQDAEKYAVQKTIEAFFEGFHQQDSTAIKATAANKVVLQTIAKDSLSPPNLSP